MRLDTDKRLKVLYVEDEEKTREQVASCLKYFFDVTVAENGKIGLEKFHSDESFDLIITDLLMLEKTGLELIDDIRTTHKDLPIVIASAYVDEYKEKLDSIKNIRAVKKPFSIKDLIENARELVVK